MTIKRERLASGILLRVAGNRDAYLWASGDALVDVEP